MSFFYSINVGLGGEREMLRASVEMNRVRDCAGGDFEWKVEDVGAME